MNIVLTGFMATGKTVVGKNIAKVLSMSFIDLDETIERDVGMTISGIFKHKGERYFRDVETKAVKCVSLLDNFVIATGGGVVLKKENMDELEKKGVIICLTASPRVIFRRARKSKVRPLLNVEKAEERIEELLRQRRRFYKRCSLTVDTSEKTVEEITERIVKFIEENKKGGKN